MQENEKKFCDIIFMDTVTSTETEWLWYPYIPRGKLTIIQGDPGEGKSTFALYLAAMITRGTRVDAPNIGERAPAIRMQRTACGIRSSRVWNVRGHSVIWFSARTNRGSRSRLRTGGLR